MDNGRLGWSTVALGKHVVPGRPPACSNYLLRAAEVLREVMNDSSQQGAARVGAAKTVLDFAARMMETEDLAARVEVLEREAES